ncbi:phosphotransferase enzyme family protein [Candidatus Uabimicrobium amorphum]|uniref:Aminoglycoside phosphotransferase n=1 Tax=Uabimicrobium amorphum TaxID=2596890 RepID=A0A5S9F8G3_UABAM|nr:phosphotransferase [Candidatus Uabimicrobium amorphum]BBM88242.1 aminoglycoside phosphotransferase [Candidatus Uabimicrobium amorphum]
MIPFAQASERSQAYRLRKLAMAVIEQYPLAIKKVNYIQNGENATFQLIDKKGKKYLLRVHRYGYHTTQAIQEELQWLISIGKSTDIQVPQPIKSKSGTHFVIVKHPAMSHPRHCAVFHWVEGRFLWKHTNENYMHKLGALIAQLQKTGKKRKIQHRKYWSIDGLIGRNSKFGDLEDVIGIPRKQHNLLIRARDSIYEMMILYEKNNPKKVGLMHADLHFGNFVVNKGVLGAIDFDDSGVGLHSYDLAIPMRSLAFFTEYEKRSDLSQLCAALLEGYAEHMPLNEKDIQHVKTFQAIRQLVMLGWLQSRSDIPRLKKRIPIAAKNAMVYIKDNLDIL